MRFLLLTKEPRGSSRWGSILKVSPNSRSLNAFRRRATIRSPHESNQRLSRCTSKW
jgi:hypothetical protein